MATSYFAITGKCEEVDENSYTAQSGEVISRIRLSLVVPGMRDRVTCELPLDAAPKSDVLERWELEETWVVVSADGMRSLAFKRANARAGEKDVGSLVVFSGTDAREATADERKALQQARKAQKVRAKQLRAQRQAEREAVKRAEVEAAAQVAPLSA